MKAKSIYTFTHLADLLHYTGKDRVRSVRRLFKRFGVPCIRRDRNTSLATEGSNYMEGYERKDQGNGLSSIRNGWIGGFILKLQVCDLCRANDPQTL